MMCGSLMLLASCAGVGVATSDPATVCAGWRPILLSDAALAALDAQDGAAVLAHNLFGERIGCWTSPAPLIAPVATIPTISSR